MSKFRGTYTALITPFRNGEVDYPSLKKLVEFQIGNGVDGFIINGTTAESPTLLEAEVEEIFIFVRKIVGQDIPLIVGTGSNSTTITISNSLKAQKMGADAVLVVVPYYNKPPQRGLELHFKNIADALSIPVILYNVPGRTITSLELKTIQSLAKVENILAIKEASGQISFAKEISTALSPDFTLLSGDDGTYVDFLEAGGHGVISVATHIIPQPMVQWKKWVENGEVSKAKEDIKKYAKLIDLLFCEANPIPVKKALQLMGVIESAELRLPLTEMNEELVAPLQDEMKRLGLL